MSAEPVIHTVNCRSADLPSRGRMGRIAGPLLTLAATAAVMVPTVGCKSGMSMTKPSWWSFGGGGGDTDKLAAAPSFSSDTKKPSEVNTPYPTTSTPNGYVINGSAASGGPAAAPATQPATPIGPVVYGSTPAPMATAAAAAPAATAVSQPATVTTQTGPYATLAGETIPPPGQPLPQIAPSSMPAASTASMAAPSAPASAAALDMPASGGASFRPADAAGAAAGYSNFTTGAAAPAAVEPPAARVADSRAVDPAAGMQPQGLSGDAATAGYGGSRYATQSASRFTTGGAPMASPASYGPASYGQPAGDSAFPPPEASMPTNSPPAAMPVSQPGSPGLLPESQSQPPVRRPDPGYRPFKTGSYRPSHTILADEPASVPGAVRTASYEEAAASTLQR